MTDDVYSKPSTINDGVRERVCEIIRENWPNKGPCLIPRAEAVNIASMLVSSHERDFCQCDMRAIYETGHADTMKRAEKLVLAIEESIYCSDTRVKEALAAWRGGMMGPEFMGTAKPALWQREINKLEDQLQLARSALIHLADINQYDGDSAFSINIPMPDKPGFYQPMNGYTYAKYILKQMEKMK